MKILSFIILISLFSTPALADCYLNGAPYPTGTIVAGLTCQADGSWR